MGSVHFSSATDNWATPQDFFDKVARDYNFTLDVCASRSNAKCPSYYSIEDGIDGLLQTWKTQGDAWMNPPYGRGIGAWMKKAYEESYGGQRVVCLVPARTDTAWWHDYAMQSQITFIRGRLKFGGSKNSAPFPSALCVFEANKKGCDLFIATPLFEREASRKDRKW